MKKFAVILSGCGVYDGSEIHEATLSMLAICQLGHSYQLFAPNISQVQVINHFDGKTIDEKRNVLIESARIARGKILDLKLFNSSEYDIVLFIGGFGVAKNLCDFAFKGNNYQVIPEIKLVIETMYNAGKPIGAMCIAPILLAAVLKNIQITLGDVCEASIAAEKHGSKHIVATHGEVIVDEKNKIATSPCYMLDANILQIAEGAYNIVKSLLELTNK